MSRYATRFNKRDANEAPILDALEAMGVNWIEAGPLDGWINVAGQWIPCEIKMPDGRFTAGQKAFIDICKAFSWPHVVWRTPEEAIQFVQISREALR